MTSVDIVIALTSAILFAFIFIAYDTKRMDNPFRRARNSLVVDSVDVAEILIFQTQFWIVLISRDTKNEQTLTTPTTPNRQILVRRGKSCSA